MVARKILLDLLGNKCEICGLIHRLTFHHKDKNPRNNALDNIQLLCQSCHLRVHSKHNSDIKTNPRKYNDIHNLVTFKLSPKGKTGILYIPADIVKDSNFPLKEGKVIIEIKNQELIIRKKKA